MTKETIRKHYQELRKALSPKQLEDISEKICHRLFSTYQLEGKKMSLFLPIERKKEINTYQIWEKAMDFGAQVAVPKTNFKTNEMKQVLFESTAQLNISRFGIPEPRKGRVIAAEHFDFVFIPLLAFDREGNRVGYGKGFYDRFLKKCSPRCTFVGLSHFDQHPESIDDLDVHDVKLDVCITPHQIYRFQP